MSPSPPPQQVTDKSQAQAPAAPFQTLTTAAKDPSSTGMARWLATNPKDESWSSFKLTTSLHSNQPSAFNPTATATTYINASNNVNSAGSSLQKKE
jgi:hypothetical protein